MENNYILENQARINSNIMKSFSEDSTSGLFEKSEGSRGGKIIGHTTSGKPIYDSANHSSHSNFTSKDHAEAGTLQSKRAHEEHKKANPDSKWGYDKDINSHSVAHNDMSEKLGKKEKKAADQAYVDKHVSKESQEKIKDRMAATKDISPKEHDEASRKSMQEAYSKPGDVEHYKKHKEESMMHSYRGTQAQSLMDKDHQTTNKIQGKLKRSPNDESIKKDLADHKAHIDKFHVKND